MKLNEPLTIQDVIGLGNVIASQGKKVRLLLADGGLASGTSRHIVKSSNDYGLLGADDDIRIGCLRITLDSGWDVAYSVMAIAKMSMRGEFAVERS